MSFEKTTDTSILDRVLPEYRKVSEAPLDDEFDDRRYKTVDSRSGNIFLVRNPSTWVLFGDEKGRTFKRRPTPELVMTADEAKTSAMTVTAGFIKETKRQSVFGA